MLGDSGQHPRAYFFAIVECKYEIRPTGTGKNTMRCAVLPLDCPADAKQGGEDLLSFC
jgi:hypothetical protein